MSKSSDILRPFTDAKAMMEDRIEYGIEYGRKNVLSIGIFHPDNSPVPGCKVKVRQRKLDFNVGANLFMLEGFESEELNRAYEKRFADLFDLATVPFYWSTLEPEQGKPRYTRDSPRIYRRPPIDPCVDFCERNGIEPKAHCLNYVPFAPDWAVGTVEKEKAFLLKRFRELAERYAARIPSWEVTNETFSPFKSQKSSFYDSPDFIEWSFKAADRYFPANRLIINEAMPDVFDNGRFFGQNSTYYLKAQRAIERGARIDMIGMQYHIFFREEEVAEKTRLYYDPDRLYDVMDAYAKLGRKLQITETTIPAYHWTEEDEGLQAEIIRNLYRIWFSHPAMGGVVYWNLVDGYTWAPGCDPHDMTAGENYYHGGLFRKDMTPKPAYDVIKELVTKEWRTDGETETKASGLADIKAFYGLYDVEIVLPDGKTLKKTVNFVKEGHRRFDYLV